VSDTKPTPGSIRVLSRAALVAVFASACVLCAAGAADADAVTVRDAAGRTITINNSSRIVSIGGAVTEILYALGLEDRIIAVDTTSVYPERALAEKPNVGYMRQLSPEGVLGLSPTLILAAEGAGPPNTIAVLEAANIPFVQMPDDNTTQGVIEKIRMVALATGRPHQGDCLAHVVRADFDALAIQRARITHPLKALFVLSFVTDRPMVAGVGTAADSAILLAGASNAMADIRGYKLVNDEAIVAAKPDVVVAMQRPRQAYSAETVFARPAFAMTPAANRRGFLSMDGEYLLSFGPRAARAARDLGAYLYPDQVRDRLPSERETDGPCLH
jgi:iron complex transport system substrate-binding protein